MPKIEDLELELKEQKMTFQDILNAMLLEGREFYRPTIKGGILQGATYRTLDTQASFEIFPEYDKTIGIIVKDTNGVQVFRVDVDGTNVGDVTMGNYDNDQGAKWDSSAGTFDVKGTFTLNGQGVLISQGSFGGDASDGALTIASGSTTINLGGARIVIKNYSSISITGTGQLAFSNPHANGTYIILKSQGDVTITSSTTPCIDASGMGTAGGASASAGANTTTPGNNARSGTQNLFFVDYGDGASGGGPGSGGSVAAFQYNNVSQVLNRYPAAFVSTGGGSGTAVNTDSGGTINSGEGGDGGPCLIIECAGAWNFTTASGISIAGTNGGDPSRSGTTTGRAGGGGAGSGGYFSGVYNSLTANTGTVTKSGGVGGNRDTWGDANNAYGGGSGASAINAGNNGTSSTVSGAKTGGDGAEGLSEVLLNTFLT